MQLLEAPDCNPPISAEVRKLIIVSYFSPHFNVCDEFEALIKAKD